MLTSLWHHPRSKACDWLFVGVSAPVCSPSPPTFSLLLKGVSSVWAAAEAAAHRRTNPRFHSLSLSLSAIFLLLFLSRGCGFGVLFGRRMGVLLVGGEGVICLALDGWMDEEKTEAWCCLGHGAEPAIPASHRETDLLFFFFFFFYVFFFFSAQGFRFAPFILTFYSDFCLFLEKLFAVKAEERESAGPDQNFQETWIGPWSVSVEFLLLLHASELPAHLSPPPPSFHGASECHQPPNRIPLAPLSNLGLCRPPDVPVLGRSRSISCHQPGPGPQPQSESHAKV